MRSLFFGARERRCLVSELENSRGALIRRFDISNGLVCLEASIDGEGNPGFAKEVSGIDRMLAFLFVLKGRLSLHERSGGQTIALEGAESTALLSSRQNLALQSPAGTPLHAFALFVGDFFIRRYLTGNREEPIDRLYAELAEGTPFRLIHRRPVDALSEYLIRHIRASSRKSTLSNIATEHRALELLIHQLGMMEWERSGDLSEEERLITDRAKEVLLARYAEALTIPELARLVRSNDFKLKRAFKKRFGTTIHSYVQTLRLEEANRLLRDRMMSVSEVAHAVGYRHPGHFSALFFERFGLYPGDLLKNPFRDGGKS
jgi:AraC-like DNA-binding protein